jgi:hypothetical protein
LLAALCIGEHRVRIGHAKRARALLVALAGFDLFGALLRGLFCCDRSRLMS